MNRKWLIRTAVVVFAVGGALLGSYVHAHAATTAARTAPSVVVYGTQGNGGFADPRTKPSSMKMENGDTQFRRIAWPSAKWGKASVTSRRAQERDCGHSGCTKWVKVSVKFYSIKIHRQKNIGGGYIKIRYYSKLVYTNTPGGNPIWLYFDTGSGTNKPVWYQPYCSIHGGPCTASHARLLAALVPASAHCRWHLNVSHSRGSFWVRARLRRYSPACGRKHLRFRAAGLCLTVSGTHGERGNWIRRVPQLSSARCPSTFWVNWGYDYQFGRHSKIHFVKTHGA